jgi:hypothetical protein
MEFEQEEAEMGNGGRVSVWDGNNRNNENYERAEGESGLALRGPERYE